jgi:hypothetical protein
MGWTGDLKGDAGEEMGELGVVTASILVIRRIIDRTLLSRADAGKGVSILDRSRRHDTRTKRRFNGDGVPRIKALEVHVGCHVREEEMAESVWLAVIANQGSAPT